MKKVLFQSDDFGLTYGVADGIIHGIKEGIIRNTGLFVNMPSSKYAVERLKEIDSIDYCLGIDINLVAGKPVTNPQDIPTLVNKDGHFLSSKEMMKRSKLIKIEGVISLFDRDPYPYNEVLLEVENQVKKFIELVGHIPDYLSPHSLLTPNINRALKEVSEKYGIYRVTTMFDDSSIKPVPGFLELSKNISINDQIEEDVEKKVINGLKTVDDGEYAYYIFHCGYVDYDLFNESSMTLRRMKDLYAATSKNVKEYIKRNNIVLINYKDIINKNIQ